MTNKEAEQLIKLVASPTWNGFIEYKTSKLIACHLELEHAKGDRVLQIQGRIQEIRADLRLKDDVLEALNNR